MAKTEHYTFLSLKKQEIFHLTFKFALSHFSSIYTAWNSCNKIISNGVEIFWYINRSKFESLVVTIVKVTNLKNTRIWWEILILKFTTERKVLQLIWAWCTSGTRNCAVGMSTAFLRIGCWVWSGKAVVWTAGMTAADGIGSATFQCAWNCNCVVRKESIRRVCTQRSRFY